MNTRKDIFDAQRTAAALICYRRRSTWRELAALCSSKRESPDEIILPLNFSIYRHECIYRINRIIWCYLFPVCIRSAAKPYISWTWTYSRVRVAQFIVMYSAPRIKFSTKILVFSSMFFPYLGFLVSWWIQSKSTLIREFSGQKHWCKKCCTKLSSQNWRVLLGTSQ
jgi:hypothetical protein